MGGLARIQDIERLRGVAVAMVVYYHLGTDGVLPLLPSGWQGVDLFFVVSGFVVTQSLARDLEGASPAPSLLRAFYLRRFYRLAPAGMVSIGLGFLSFLQGTGEFYRPMWRAGGLELLAIATGTYNYALRLPLRGLFGWFWSLTVEEHFYAVLPFFLLLVRRTGQRLAVSAFFVALTVLVTWRFTPNLGKFPEGIAGTHLHLHGLFGGVILALVPPPAAPRGAGPRRIVTVLVVPALLGVTFLAPVVVAHPYGERVVIFLCSVLLVRCASSDQDSILPWPLGSALVYLGERSYAVYLVHQPLLSLFRDQTPGWLVALRGVPQTVATVMLATISVLAVGELVHRLVEVPFRRDGAARASGRDLPQKPGRPWTLVDDPLLRFTSLVAGIGLVERCTFGLLAGNYQVVTDVVLLAGAAATLLRLALLRRTSAASRGCRREYLWALALATAGAAWLLARDLPGGPKAFHVVG